MKTLFYKYIVLLLILLGVAACSEDELVKQSTGRFDSGNFLTTEAEAEQAIIGIYDYLSVAYNNYNDWSSLFAVKVLPADDANAGGAGPADAPKLQQIGRLVHEMDNPAIKDVWHSLYRIVNASNALINNVGDVDNKDRAIAEAKFFRAYAYFELVTMYGAVPYYTVNAATKAEESKPRTDVATVYAAIEKDLTDAIAVLPLKSELPALQKYRASKGSAQSLLGKVYLYQKKYPQAHQILQTVIDSDEYGLEPDYSTIWLRENRAGRESIFEVLYTSTNGHDWNGPWDGTAESNFMIILMGPRGGAFDNLGVIGLNAGWGVNVPTAKIGDLLYADAGVARRNGSVISEADFVAKEGVVNRAVADFHWAQYENYIRIKYSTVATETGDPVPEVNYGTPFKIIRYADVLLMAAEAYNKDSKDALAVPLIKLVRERAGDSNHSAWEGLTGDALFNFIVKERQLELAFEGQRYWDLVRWGLAAQEIPGFKANKHELFPIPLDEINLNSAIEISDQNPGY
ncbi:MAG TPA: RagB/SusD family nutrient uptake outer membrane protein [Marinilabiliaceae bacterium]|nr:RagB/SusD family nutrient uptake outer membrane protein [Marinilabiliaceae bacterium]